MRVMVLQARFDSDPMLDHERRCFVAATGRDRGEVHFRNIINGVPRTVARLFNPERESVYRKLGVRYVSGTGILSKLFLNEFRDDAMPHHILLPDDDVEIVDLTLGPGAHGITVEDFELDGRLRVAAVSRSGTSRIPDPDDRLERGDVVTAAAVRGIRRRLAPLLADTEA